MAQLSVDRHWRVRWAIMFFAVYLIDHSLHTSWKLAPI